MMMNKQARSTATQLTVRLEGRRHRIVGLAWVFICAVAVMLYLLSLPLAYAERLRQAYTLFATALPNLGLTVDFYAAFFIAVALLLSLFGISLGVFVMWRRSDEPMAVLVAALLVISNAQNITGFNVWAGEMPAVEPLLVASNALSYTLIFANLLLFPDGHLYPRWSRWLLGLVVPLTIADGIYSFGRSTSVTSFASPFLIGIGLLGFVALFVQRQRYLHHLTGTQRQQVKWVIYGFFIANLPIILFNIVDPFITPWLIPRPEVRVLYRFGVQIFILGIPFLAWTLALGISIFRYRLWDIDYAINRSLGYAIVSAMLVALFIILFMLLQSLITEPLGLVALALGVGLLFNPLRRRVQGFIDKRVYGLRYSVESVAARGRTGAEARVPRAVPVPEITHRGAFSGQTVGGYVLGDLIGRGGMGEVYKAYTGTQVVAMKIISGMADAETRTRFVRESEIMERLKHPNIVKFYEYGEQDAIRYLVLDYIAGIPLNDFLKAGHAITMETVRKILTDLTGALEYIHARGVVHRDLKPANIMLMVNAQGQPERAILMDFGIAKSATTSITGTETMGTIDYMAPEQIQAAGTVDARADIYALGVMLYEMVTGRRPFQGNPGQVLFAHLRQPPPDMRQWVPDLPTRISGPILRALNKAPAERFASVSELAAALAA